MKKVLLTLFVVGLSLAQTPKKGVTKSLPYDPDKLSPGEVACGRIGAKNSAPCKCIEHRAKELAKQREKCYTILNEKAQRECFRTTDDVCAVHVVDVDEERRSTDYEGDEPKVRMPRQCSRSCTKAKCECCHS